MDDLLSRVLPARRTLPGSQEEVHFAALELFFKNPESSLLPHVEVLVPQGLHQGGDGRLCFGAEIAQHHACPCAGPGILLLAQRLVRVICPRCKVPAGPRMTPFGDQIETFKGSGCDPCFHTGFVGRLGIFEMMELNDDIRTLIMKNADATEITNAARRNGMRNLREDGWLKVAAGVTTADEVMRVTQEF